MLRDARHLERIRVSRDDLGGTATKLDSATREEVGLVALGCPHLSLDELDWDDRIAIFNICNEGAIRLQPFRRESEAALGAALPGGGLQPEAEQLSGDS